MLARYAGSLSRGVARGVRCAQAEASDGVVFRHPTRADAKAMYDIVVRGTLDNNSAYAYMIYAEHFKRTCIVAEDDGKVLGFIMGYRPPTSPDALFVWQVGVDEAARGRKIAGRMLNSLAKELTADGVTHVEATVTPSNTPSRKLFRGFARDAGVPCEESDFFVESDFPASTEGHEGEDYFRIGPFTADKLQGAPVRGMHTSAREPGAAGGVRGFHTSAPRPFIIRDFEDVEKSGNVQKAGTGTWESRRYLLRKDGMGFSFHHTILYAGSETLIWYRNHVEAVMIVQGEGEIELVGEGQKQGEGVVHKLQPWTMYALNGHERHFLRAAPDTDMHVVCAFNPPVAGTEDHNEAGVYPAVGDDGKPIFDVKPEHLSELVQPPEVMKGGGKQ